MIWQANKYGKYTHEYDRSEIKDDPHFQGWGQVVTNEEGEYGFKTIKPAAYPLDLEKNDWCTPHIHFKVSRRGYIEFQRNSANNVTGLVFHRHYEFPTITAEKIE